MSEKKLIGPFSQLLTLSNMPDKGSLLDSQLEIIHNAGIIIEDGTIKKVGIYLELKQIESLTNFEEILEPCVVIPAFVDCHTHICFAGNRANDFAMRNAGISYLEIAKQGGGIWSSVVNTRKATLHELTQNTVARANKHLQQGITTIEVKSGYGLTTDNELKMLQAIQNANRQTKANLVSTLLAAHIKPQDYEGSAKKYLEHIVEEIFPKAKELTRRIDIFIEQTAFSFEDASWYLDKANDFGFQTTIHADQFTTGSSVLGVQKKALSVDHLEASTDKEILAIAQSDTVAVALPGASIGLGEPFAPARKLLNQGACLAIASDWNPGSAPQGDLLMQASLLATFQKLSTAEVFAGLTFRAAKALAIQYIGKIETHYQADFQAYPTAHYQDILYHQGSMKPCKVWKSGELIFI